MSFLPVTGLGSGAYSAKLFATVITNHRSRIVRKYPEHRWQVADAVVDYAE
jgi:hypothetical protein